MKINLDIPGIQINKYINKYDNKEINDEVNVSQVKKNPEISDFLQGNPSCFRQVSSWYNALKRETLQITELNQLIR